jgi:hypothetical protein
MRSFRKFEKQKLEKRKRQKQKPSKDSKNENQPQAPSILDIDPSEWQKVESIPQKRTPSPMSHPESMDEAIAFANLRRRQRIAIVGAMGAVIDSIASAAAAHKTTAADPEGIPHDPGTPGNLGPQGPEGKHDSELWAAATLGASDEIVNAATAVVKFIEHVEVLYSLHHKNVGRVFEDATITGQLIARSFTEPTVGRLQSELVARLDMRELGEAIEEWTTKLEEIQGFMAMVRMTRYPDTTE